MYINYVNIIINIIILLYIFCFLTLNFTFSLFILGKYYNITTINLNHNHVCD